VEFYTQSNPLVNSAPAKALVHLITPFMLARPWSGGPELPDYILNTLLMPLMKMKNEESESKAKAIMNTWATYEKMTKTMNKPNIHEAICNKPICAKLLKKTVCSCYCDWDKNDKRQQECAAFGCKICANVRSASSTFKSSVTSSNKSQPTTPISSQPPTTSSTTKVPSIQSAQSSMCLNQRVTDNKTVVPATVKTLVYAAERFVADASNHHSLLYRRHSVSNFAELFAAYPETQYCIDIDDNAQVKIYNDNEQQVKATHSYVFIRNGMLFTGT
jgi:hypothetical protein